VAKAAATYEKSKGSKHNGILQQASLFQKATHVCTQKGNTLKKAGEHSKWPKPPQMWEVRAIQAQQLLWSN